MYTMHSLDSLGNTGKKQHIHVCGSTKKQQLLKLFTNLVDVHLHGASKNLPE